MKIFVYIVFILIFWYVFKVDDTDIRTGRKKGK